MARQGSWSYGRYFGRSRGWISTRFNAWIKCGWIEGRDQRGITVGLEVGYVVGISVGYCVGTCEG